MAVKLKKEIKSKIFTHLMSAWSLMDDLGDIDPEDPAENEFKFYWFKRSVELERIIDKIEEEDYNGEC